MKSVPVSEVFFSIQGEGLYVGVPQIFVRFSGCNITCVYCDTPAKPSRLFDTAGLNAEIVRLLARFPVHSVSLTGGEPLVYADFLRRLLAKRSWKKPCVYLETNGILYHALPDVRDYVQIVAMDIKLPSATKAGVFWDEHAHFIEQCSGVELFTKCVITPATQACDVKQAVRLVHSFNKRTPFVLQPQTGVWNQQLRRKIISFAKIAGNELMDVRIIPQMHKLWGVP